MKTYAEQQGEKAFDWNKFLENPPEKGSEEHWDAGVRSGDWVTCACGNQCDIIPRSSLGCPNDDKLERLGSDFYTDVNAGEWECAKNTLYLIEKRSAEIIEGLTKLN